MTNIEYRDIDAAILERITNIWGDWVTKYNCVHIDKGCVSIAAFIEDEPVGFISAYPKALPMPISGVNEMFIDVIEVGERFRRLGIAREMIRRVEDFTRMNGRIQVRAWSSEDKAAAVNMWNALGYAMCPAFEMSGSGELIKGYYVAKRV